MQHQFSAVEKYLITNTLNCLPIMLQGHAVLIDLRNECSCAGILQQADGQMNLELSNAVFIDRNDQQYAYDNFLIRNRMIRQIHIPSTVDIVKELRSTMERGILRRNTPRQQKLKPSFKQKRASERHKEILASISKEKQK